MIKVISPCFNASRYIIKNIESIKKQTVKQYDHYIIDDLSLDDTVKNIKDNLDQRVHLIQNDKKRFAVGNIDLIIQNEKFSENDIVLIIDGDDWLLHDRVFQYILKIYQQNKNIWVTYGQFVHYHKQGLFSPGFAAPPQGGIKNIRKAVYTTSHLRTFRPFLFKNIKKEDLMTPQGWYIPIASDLAWMIPILQMAGDKRSMFLNRISYVYNVQTSINDYKVNFQKQKFYQSYIKNKKPYQMI